MVSEKAEELLGISADSPCSKQDIAVAFWLKTEEIDRKIVDIDDEKTLDALLDEKDQLLEARALLEGLSIQQIRKEILEKDKVPKIAPWLLILAVVGWLIVVVLVILAVKS